MASSSIQLVYNRLRCGRSRGAWPISRWHCVKGSIISPWKSNEHIQISSLYMRKHHKPKGKWKREKVMIMKVKLKIKLICSQSNIPTKFRISGFMTTRTEQKCLQQRIWFKLAWKTELTGSQSSYEMSLKFLYKKGCWLWQVSEGNSDMLITSRGLYKFSSVLFT